MRGFVLGLTLALSVGYVSPAPAQPSWLRTETADFRDIVLGAPDKTSLRIGRIALTGFKTEGGRVTASRAELSDMTFATGTARTTIPNMLLTDLVLPAPLFEAISKSGSPTLDWAALVSQASASEIAFARAGMRDSGSKASADYSGFSVKSIANGIAQSIRIGMIASTSTDPSGTTVTAAINDTRYEKVDIAETIRFFTGGGQGQRKVLAASGSTGAFKMTVPDVKIESSRLEMGTLYGRAPTIGMPLAAVHAMQGNVPSLEKTDQIKQMVAYYREALQYFSIDRYVLRAVTATTPAGPVALGDITIADLSGNGLGTFSISGMNFATPAGPVRLGEFEIRKFNWKALMEMGLEAATSGKEPDIDPANALKLIPTLEALRFANISAGTPFGPLSLEEFNIGLPAGAGGMPDTLGLLIKALKVDLSQFPPTNGGQFIHAMGYKDLTVNAQARLRYAAAERAVYLEVPALDLSNVGTADLVVKLTDIDLPARAENIDEAKVDSLTLNIADNGLGNRAFAMIASSAGISPDAMRAAIAAEAKSQALKTYGAAMTPGSAEAIEAFLRGGKRITLRAVPKPGTVVQLGDLNVAGHMLAPVLIGKLAVTITTDQGGTAAPAAPDQTRKP